MDKKTSRSSRASSKSPSRSKKASRPKSKSPGRPKSPGRKSPARNKSPARGKSPAKPKSPKSPRRAVGRPAKSPAKNLSPSRRASPSRKSPIRSTPLAESSLEQRISPFVRIERQGDFTAKIFADKDVTRDRSASVAKPSTSASLSSRAYTEDTSMIRRSNRLKQTESERSEKEKMLKSNSAVQYERKYGEKPSRDFGSWPGATLFMLALPAITLLLQISCSKSKCIGLVTPSTNWKVYLDLQTFGYYMAYAVWLGVLSSLPVGRKATYNHVHTRLSSLYIALLTFAAMGSLYYYGYNVTAMLGKSVALLSSAVLFGLLLSVILFIKGGRSTSGHNVNADGNTVYDFFIGREIYPTVGSLSIKTWIVRMEVIGILLLDALYLLKYVETHAAGVHSPTLLFNVIAHSIYALDALWFEEQFMTTFEAQYEGVGYMSTMAAATWPFLFTLSTRYIVYTNYEAPTYLLAICGIMFALGYFVYRASNAQKAEFRKNPQHPAFSKLDTLPTIFGKRLISGGWWRIVRHPNYTGDIIMMWSVASICALSHWLPYFFPIFHLLVLIHRTFRVETRCKNLYTSTWNRYTDIAKQRLVPGVF